tara:strand:+ start:27508 stop:28734 length:1227 start_codon:yes stop_codon:yes gene_type:complete
MTTWSANGQKSNLKMSDLAAEFGKSNSNIKLSEFHRGDTVVDTVGIYGGTGRARYGSEYDGNDGLTTVKPIPCLTYNDARSRIRTSSTGTPTVALLAQDSATAQASLGNFTGLCQDDIFPHDACGQSLNSGTVSTFDSGRTGSTLKVNSSGSYKNHVKSTIKGCVTRTGYTNTTHTFNLGTVCAAGDRIVMVASTGGGTMYNAVSYSAARIKSYKTDGNLGGSWINGVPQIHRKSESGTDTWAICQHLSCVGGENRVTWYPYAASSYPICAHVFVIKNAGSGMSVFAAKETNNNNMKDINAVGQAQRGRIEIFSSPFTSNGFNNTSSLPSPSTLGYFNQFYQSQSLTYQQGAWALSTYNDQEIRTFSIGLKTPDFYTYNSSEGGGQGIYRVASLFRPRQDCEHFSIKV